jgi:hypothetical protein
MKVQFLTTLFLFGACHGKKNLQVPSFESNSSLNEDYLMIREIRDILSKKDFSVIFYNSIEDAERTYKIFCLKDTVWEKIEIVDGLVELDTLIKKDDAIFVGKKVQLTKVTPKKEALYFLEKLKKYGLFTLPEDKELFEKCKQDRADHDVPEYSHRDASLFFLVQGEKVRWLNYKTQNRKEDCPTLVDTYNRIDSIETLFKKEWYVKKHY